jgi:hypothetical protein
MAERQRSPMAERQRSPMAERQRSPMAERQRSPMAERQRSPLAELLVLETQFSQSQLWYHPRSSQSPGASSAQ